MIIFSNRLQETMSLLKQELTQTKLRADLTKVTYYFSYFIWFVHYDFDAPIKMQQ